MKEQAWWSICDKEGAQCVDYSGRAFVFKTRAKARDAIDEAKRIYGSKKLHVERSGLDDLK